LTAGNRCQEYQAFGNDVVSRDQLLARQEIENPLLLMLVGSMIVTVTGVMFAVSRNVGGDLRIKFGDEGCWIGLDFFDAGWTAHEYSSAVNHR
jgi:hypothetical protein